MALFWVLFWIEDEWGQAPHEQKHPQFRTTDNHTIKARIAGAIGLPAA